MAAFFSVLATIIIAQRDAQSHKSILGKWKIRKVKFSPYMCISTLSVVALHNQKTFRTFVAIKFIFVHVCVCVSRGLFPSLFPFSSKSRRATITDYVTFRRVIFTVSLGRLNYFVGPFKMLN